MVSGEETPIATLPLTCRDADLLPKNAAVLGAFYFHCYRGSHPTCSINQQGQESSLCFPKVSWPGRPLDNLTIFFF